ncbi:MAG: hypothetical protein CL840_02280 [Crocinitomicaceae bacterium]|nr:hypothetical protein [Crocinitomicaceae bacterium]|tara:strand:- start:3061 stop:3522 length:462 start_codon:yes stop_codon:yes gene_type:complete
MLRFLHNKIKVLLIIAILICSCTFSPSDTLSGTWKLYRIKQQDSLSEKWIVSDWMKNGSGTLIYKPNGMMSVEFIPEKYGLDSTATKYAYTASFQYDPKLGLVTHKRITHTDPKEIGKVVTRKLELTNDTLIIHAKEFGLRLKWINQTNPTGF